MKFSFSPFAAIASSFPLDTVSVVRAGNKGLRFWSHLASCISSFSMERDILFKKVEDENEESADEKKKNAMGRR